jgi:hypothetical protein
MRKLIVCLSLAAFALVSAAQAGEGEKAKAACTEQTKAACAEQAKSCAASSCCAKEAKVAKKMKAPAPKGAMLLVQR